MKVFSSLLNEFYVKKNTKAMNNSDAIKVQKKIVAKRVMHHFIDLLEACI